MEKDSNYFKGSLICFSGWTIVFGLGFWAILGNFKIALIIGMVIALIGTVGWVVEQQICEKYKLPKMIEEIEEKHHIFWSGGATLLKGQEKVSEQDTIPKGGVLCLLEQGVYFKEITPFVPCEILVPYSDIREIEEGARKLKLIIIHLKNEKTLEIAVEQKEIWVKKIQELMNASVEKE